MHIITLRFYFMQTLIRQKIEKQNQESNTPSINLLRITNTASVQETHSNQQCELSNHLFRWPNDIFKRSKEQEKNKTMSSPQGKNENFPLACLIFYFVIYLSLCGQKTLLPH